MVADPAAKHAEHPFGTGGARIVVRLVTLQVPSCQRVGLGLLAKLFEPDPPIRDFGHHHAEGRDVAQRGLGTVALPQERMDLAAGGGGQDSDTASRHKAGMARSAGMPSLTANARSIRSAIDAQSSGN